MCICETYVNYGSDCMVYCLPKHNTVQSGRYILICTNCLEDLTACSFREGYCGCRFILNVNTFLPDYVVSHTRRHYLLAISGRTVHCPVCVCCSVQYHYTSEKITICTARGFMLMTHHSLCIGD